MYFHFPIIPSCISISFLRHSLQPEKNFLNITYCEYLQEQIFLSCCLSAMVILISLPSLFFLGKGPLHILLTPHPPLQHPVFFL